MEEENGRKKFFERTSIRDLFYEKNYKQVIKRAEQYFEKYGIDEKIIYFMACSYKELKMYDKAIDWYKYNVDLNERKKSHYGAYRSYFDLYFTYYHLNMYKEAYALIDKIEKYKSNLTEREIKEFEISQIVLKHKLGIEHLYDYKYPYINKQLSNYNEDEVLDYIKLYCESSNLPQYTYFFEKIDVDYLYYYIKENLINYQKSTLKMGLDTYFFSIANIGFDFAKKNACNILKVLTIPGTHQIINMYPVLDTLDKALVLDIDYDKLFKKNKEKVKTLSQIDKFNRRYSR